MKLDEGEYSESISNKYVLCVPESLYTGPAIINIRQSLFFQMSCLEHKMRIDMKLKSCAREPKITALYNVTVIP